ncbi:hypothetical protein GCM10020218_080470 [Dactylosporangium vinaceum]
MTLAGVLEFILGNTFTFVVFCSFGALIYKFVITICHPTDLNRWLLVFFRGDPNPGIQCDRGV